MWSPKNVYNQQQFWIPARAGVTRGWTEAANKLKVAGLDDGQLKLQNTSCNECGGQSSRRVGPRLG